MLALTSSVMADLRLFSYLSYGMIKVPGLTHWVMVVRTGYSLNSGAACLGSSSVSSTLAVT